VEQIADPLGGEGSQGCLNPQEHRGAGDPAPAEAKVGDQCFADIDGQRQTVQLSSFATDGDFAVPPIDVTELKRRHFSATQSQAGQEYQDGVVASADGSATVTTAQQSHDVLGLQGTWQRRVSPASDRGYGGGQRYRHLAFEIQKAEQRTKRRDEVLGVLNGSIPTLAQHETSDIPCFESLGMAVLEQKTTGNYFLDADVGGNQATLPSQVITVANQKSIQGRAYHAGTRRRHHLQPSQEAE
jgi:hypothetical protein